MPTSSRAPRTFLLAIIVIGTLAGLIAARYRLHAENTNKRVEVALEWDEVSRLSQFTHRPIADILLEFRKIGVTSLVIQEETFTTLEQSGQLKPTHTVLSDGHSATLLDGVDPALFARLKSELTLRGIIPAAGGLTASSGETRIVQVSFASDVAGERSETPSFIVPVEYANLRTIGVGLPPDALAMAAATHLQVAGRIGNFPGVNAASAEAVLHEIAGQGVSTVIFNGEEVLGYRDMEPQVAEMLKSGSIPVKSAWEKTGGTETSVSLAYGAVEFGKQKGDEKLSAKLKGDVVRVHSIQSGELGQLDSSEAVDRFAKAARERNIRFCYVRLLTFSGADPVKDNVKFVNAITRAIHHGSALTGGNLQFGPSRRFADPKTPRVLYLIIAIGVAAGAVWMLSILIPLPDRTQKILLVAGGAFLALLVAALGDTGQKLVALLAGIVFPAAACLYSYPTAVSEDKPQTPLACVKRACKTIGIASGITAVGIVAVVGLLAARPYMVHSSQFLGIKAQHAVPLFLVAIAALIGGVALPGEKLGRFVDRARTELNGSLAEPARYGTLIFGLVVLAAMMLVIARTGNDAGVGVSGFELKARAVLDKLLPVRPRTKEFLVGHPAFVLGICWWLRGRRKLAIPAFVIGSLGQVSLLNTFCHIHTPLIISAWRDAIGLVIGIAIGAALFLIIEKVSPAPEPVR